MSNSSVRGQDEHVVKGVTGRFLDVDIAQAVATAKEAAGDERVGGEPVELDPISSVDEGGMTVLRYSVGRASAS